MKHTLRLMFLVALALLSITACGQAAPATTATLPVFPGATELKPGESAVGDTLANNNQVDAQLRQQVGVGGKVEQKGYKLPSDTTWDKVKAFYDEQLKAAGWGTNSMVSGIMEQANQGNDLFQTANWQKGNQNVTVVMVTSPTDATQKELIVSLATQ